MSLLKYESQLREPLIDGNKNYHQVTEDIIGPIEVKPGKLWFVGLSIAIMPFSFWRLFSLQGSRLWNRTMEPEPYDRMGLGYYQLRLVDRYRSCRYTYLCHSFTIQAGMENGRKPGCRSYDDIRSYVRRPVPYLSYGSCLGRFLCISLSK